MEEELDCNNPVPPYLFDKLVEEDLFEYENLNHQMDTYSSTSARFNRVLSLKETVVLTLLISLYSRVEGVLKMICGLETSISHSYDRRACIKGCF